MMTGLLALFLLLPSNSHAIALSVMENTKVSKNAIFVSTQTKNGFIGLGISTESYNGAVANVGLHSSSNVVVGNSDNVVIYATGSMVVNGAAVSPPSGGNFMFTNSTDTVSGAKTFVSSVTFGIGVSATSGLCHTISWSSGAAVSSLSISLPSGVSLSSHTFEVWIAGDSTGATPPLFFLLNNDTGSNYGGHSNANNTHNIFYEAGANASIEQSTIGQFTSGSSIDLDLIFRGEPSYPNRLRWAGPAGYYQAAVPREYGAPIDGHYLGTSPFASITLKATSGTWARLYGELRDCGAWQLQN